MPGNTALTGCHYRYLKNNTVNTTPSQTHRGTFPPRLTWRVEIILCFDFSLPMQDIFMDNHKWNPQDDSSSVLYHLHFHKGLSKLENLKKKWREARYCKPPSSVILACGRLRWEDRNFRVILGYISSSNPNWEHETLSQCNKASGLHDVPP